jgi:hypothetical protein
MKVATLICDVTVIKIVSMERSANGIRMQEDGSLLRECSQVLLCNEHGWGLVNTPDFYSSVHCGMIL